MSTPLLQTSIEVDATALSHNLHQVRQLVSPAKVLAILKSNAYGHGLLRTARALQTADGFGVSCPREAIHLRKAGFLKRIVVLQGFLSADELNLMVAYRLDAVIHQAFQLDLLEQQRLSNPISVWLKLNTGMNRLGFREISEVQAAWQVLQALKARHQVLELILMSHFANAGHHDMIASRHQWACFESLAQGLPAPRSFANSAALLDFPDSRADWVRLGALLYGISPFPEPLSPTQSLLKPAMNFSTRLIAIQALQMGDAIGYGGRYCCPRPTRLGVVAAGYGDGYPRSVPDGTPVLVNGKRAPLIGQASMNMLTVDLNTQPEAKIGDSVRLWGKDLPVEEIAKFANRSPYELVCGVHRNPDGADL